MKLSAQNQRVLDSLRASVTGFAAGDLDLDEIQAALQSRFGLLENDGTYVADLVRLAEADIEEIRFTRILDEQRPAVLFRLDKLLEELSGIEQ